jgi:hypothetical protein
MHSSFWSNTIWYILLGIPSVISIALTIYKSKNRGFTIAFMLAILLFVEFIELGLLTSTNAYRYFPKLVKDPFLDSAFATYFSQVSLTSTAVLVTVFKLRYPWYFIFAVLYYLIEVLFLRLGIYQHHWYQSWFTFAGCIPFFWLVRKWYDKMLDKPNSFLYFSTVFLGAYSVYSFMPALPFYVFRIYSINFHVFSEYYRNQAIALMLYLSIIFALMVLLYIWKTNLIWKVVIFACLFGAQYLMVKIGIMYIKDGWFFIVTTITLLGSYFSVLLIDNLFSTRNCE